MNAYLIGKQKINYTNKEGKQVEGYKLHINYQDQYTEGLACNAYYVGKNQIEVYSIVDKMTFSDARKYLVDLDFNINLDTNKAYLNTIKIIDDGIIDGVFG